MKLINLSTKQLITVEEFKAAHPNVSFPIVITAEIYEMYGYAPVFDAPRPTFDAATQKVVDIEPVLTDKGTYEQTFEVVQLTTEEVDAIAAAKAAELEQTRANQTVSMKQARLALLKKGLLADVETALAALAEPEKSEAGIIWEYATEVKRSDALVQSVSTALSWTPELLDEIFALAQTL